MGLDIPNLDEKNFDILLEEAMSRLPSLNSEWTDYNPSDLGVTIVELLAWLSDINYYRLNRIGAKHKEAFLKILGLSLGERKAAQVLVTLTSWRSVEPLGEDDVPIELDFAKKVLVPKSTEIMNADMRFITQKDIYVYPTNFNILALESKDFGKEREIRRENFYPFSKELENDFYFVIELTHKISDELTLYILTSEASDEYIEHDALEWTCYKEDTNEWVDIKVMDFSNGFKHSAEVVITLPIFSSKIRCSVKNKSYYETAPFVEKILINTLLITQEDDHKEFLGESSGYVNQHFTLKKPPMSNTLEVKVGRDIWTEAESLLTNNSVAKVYMVQDSEIIFGDGAHGCVPRRGLDINVTYLSNEGSRSNVLKGSSWECENIKFCHNSMEVHNMYDGYGGEDKRSFEEVMSSFSNSLTTPKRAVSLSDFEFLALNTPNTRLAKAKASVKKVKNKKTNHIEVIVVPLSESKNPITTEDTKKKVEAYLDERRLLTTKISIKDPKYRKVNISVDVFSQNHDPEVVRSRVIEALNLYLHPLNGGKDTAGWSFGESLYLSELYQIVSQVEGVDIIESIKINNSISPTFKVDTDTLVSSGNHDVNVKGIKPSVCGDMS